MTLASLCELLKKIFQRGDLHVLLAQQSNKDLGTNWSFWGACRGSGAKHWGAFHRKFGKSGKWYRKSRKSVQKFRKLLNFRNANLTIQPKILEIPGAKLDGKKTSGKNVFEHLGIPREVVLFFGNFEKSCSIHYWKLPKILTGRFG